MKNQNLNKINSLREHIKQKIAHMNLYPTNSEFQSQV